MKRFKSRRVPKTLQEKVDHYLLEGLTGFEGHSEDEVFENIKTKLFENLHILKTVSELRARLKTLKDHVGRYYHALKKDPKHKATPMQQYALDNVICLTIHGVGEKAEEKGDEMEEITVVEEVGKESQDNVICLTIHGVGEKGGDKGEEKGDEMEEIAVVEEVGKESQDANFIQYNNEFIGIKCEPFSKDYGDFKSNNFNDSPKSFDGPFSNQENQQNLLRPKKHTKSNSKKMTSNISMMMATELPLQVPVEKEEFEENKICPEALVVWDAFKTLPANKKPQVYLKLNQAVSAFKSAV